MFKRVLSLCVALVLVAGASGDLFAAEKDFQIEVVSPDSGVTISIGDKIEVNVYVIKGLVDSVVVVMGPAVASITELNDATTGLLTGVSPSRAKGSSMVDTFKAEVIAVGEALPALTSVATDGIRNADRVVHIKAIDFTGKTYVADDDEDDAQYYTSLSDENSGAIEGRKVGHKARLIINLVRPLTTSIFADGVSIEGGKIVDDQMVFAADSTLKITAHYRSDDGADDRVAVLVLPKAKTDKLLVGKTLVELPAAAPLLPAVNRYELTDAEMRALQDTLSEKTIIFERAAVLTETPTSVPAEELGDHLEFYLFAFTVSDVGNFSDHAYFNSTYGVEDDPATTTVNEAAGDSGPQSYIVDGILPTITIIYPEKGDRFTATFLSAGEAYIDTVMKDKKRVTNKAKQFEQNPLRIVQSENLGDNITVQVGESKGHKLDIAKTLKGAEGAKDTLLYALDPKVKYDKDGKDAVKNDTLTVSGGDKVKLSFTFSDIVGNKGKITSVDDVIFDNSPLIITDIFPNSDAVDDTVTAETVGVSMEINEDADSISVRWVQYIEDDPEGSISDPKIAKRTLNLTKGVVDDIDFAFSDDDEGDYFTLQIFARDKAGNVTLTAPDTLVFNDTTFENPVADTFRVTRPKDDDDDKVLPDSSIVGQRLTLNIEAWDRSKSKLAVTYPDKDKGQGDVLVSVKHMIEDALVSPDDKFKISEESEVEGKIEIKDIMMNSDGTVSLDDEGWVLGKRTIMVTTEKAVSMIKVTVQDTSTKSSTDQDIAEPSMTTVVDIPGERDSLVWEVGEFVSYNVMVDPVEDSRDFTITVTPADSFGNPSTKTSEVGGDEVDINANEGREFLTSRLAPKHILDKVGVLLSTKPLGFTLPTGQQSVDKDGTIFDGIAPPRGG